MKTPKIKPCPFCGSKSPVQHTEGCDGSECYLILCMMCPAHGESNTKDMDAAVKAWNRGKVNKG